MRWWNLASGEMEKRVAAHTEGVRSMAFSSNWNVLATGGEDNLVHLWDTTSGALLRSFAGTGHPHGLRTVVFSPDGKSFATAGVDDTVHIEIDEFLPKTIELS